MCPARISVLLALFVVGQALPGRVAPAQEAAVQIVLFYSPTCPHCEEVITGVLPLIFEDYGGAPKVWSITSPERAEAVVHLVANSRLKMLLIDASWPTGQHLYRASIQDFELPTDREGVPQLVIGDTVLVGSEEIPQRLPLLIQQGLDAGGTPWPQITDLEQLVAVVAQETRAFALGDLEKGVEAEQEITSDIDSAAPPALTEAEVDRAMQGPAVATSSRLETISLGRTTLAQRFGRDPLGNGLAAAVLAVMLVSVFLIWRWAGVGSPTKPPGHAIPILALVGMGVASYLSYVEVQHVMAVCGPVGDCNAVQQSEYARLFGVLPVGVLGLAGYVAILAAWFLSRERFGRVALWAKLGLLVTTVIGTLFSIYLAFLEPFVIGATCAWCLASAVILTLLMWLSARPGVDAWKRLRVRRVAISM